MLSTASAALAQRTAPFSLGEAREEQLRASMRNHGYFALQPGELPWSVDLGALARGIELLHAAGWPPAFIMAYDEAWLVAAQMAPLLERLTGNPLSFDWMAFRVPPGQPKLVVPRPTCRFGSKVVGGLSKPKTTPIGS